MNLDSTKIDNQLKNIRKYEMMGCGLSLLDSMSICGEVSEETEQVISKIDNDDFEVNNFEGFLESLGKSDRIQFLTQYSVEELEKDFTTYKVNGYDIGFAIKSDGDITSVHNNSDVRGIGDALIEAAKRKGGTKLDHFDGFLSELYKRHNFEEKGREKWNEDYAPKNWDYEQYGTPDIVYRELKKDEEK